MINFSTQGVAILQELKDRYLSNSNTILSLVELNEIFDLPQRSLQDILDSLEKRGYIQITRTRLGPRIHYYYQITIKGIEHLDNTKPEDNSNRQTKLVILFLAANPIDSTRLRLDKEIRSIDTALRLADQRDKFRIEQQWAVQVSGIQSHLLRYRPDIVHFSGHGSQSDGIFLENNDGNSQLVSTASLRTLFGLLGNAIRCVLLNSCYSQAQAAAISEYIDCVIGMPLEVEDEAAISFAASFYQALGYGQDIITAYNLGCNQLELEGSNVSYMPVLHLRNEDTKHLILL